MLTADSLSRGGLLVRFAGGFVPRGVARGRQLLLPHSVSFSWQVGRPLGRHAGVTESALRQAVRLVLLHLLLSSRPGDRLVEWERSGPAAGGGRGRWRGATEGG